MQIHTLKIKQDEFDHLYYNKKEIIYRTFADPQYKIYDILSFESDIKDIGHRKFNTEILKIDSCSDDLYVDLLINPKYRDRFDIGLPQDIFENIRDGKQTVLWLENRRFKVGNVLRVIQLTNYTEKYKAFSAQIKKISSLKNDEDYLKFLIDSKCSKQEIEHLSENSIEIKLDIDWQDYLYSSAAQLLGYDPSKKYKTCNWCLQSKRITCGYTTVYHCPYD